MPFWCYYTFCRAEICAVYSSKMTCYILGLERICVYRKGKHYENGGKKHEQGITEEAGKNRDGRKLRN